MLSRCVCCDAVCSRIRASPMLPNLQDSSPELDNLVREMLSTLYFFQERLRAKYVRLSSVLGWLPL